MKKLITILLIVSGFAAEAQYPTPIFLKPSNGYGSIYNRGKFDSALYIPTGSGAPTDTSYLFSQGTNPLFPGFGQKYRNGALYWDSTGHKLYGHDGIGAWFQVGGSGATFDTTTIYRILGTKVDTASFDTLVALVNGKMTNFGGAPGMSVGSFAARPAASALQTGVVYIAADSGFQYVDTGSGGTAGWKRLSGGSGSGGIAQVFAKSPLLVLGADTVVSDTTAGNQKIATQGLVSRGLSGKVTNSGASNGITTGTYASRPSATNCQCYYGATDSAKWYYDNGSWITMGGGSGGSGPIGNLDSINLNKSSWSAPTSLNLFDNSYGSYRPCFPAEPDTTYANRVAATWSLTLNDYSLAGAGSAYFAGQANAHLTGNTTTASLVGAAGYNDYRIAPYGSDAVYRMINGCYNSIFASHFLKSWVAANGGTGVTKFGAWTTYNAGTWRGRAGTNGATTSTLNDSIIFVNPAADSSIIVGLHGLASGGAKFLIYLDGVLMGNFTEDGMASGVPDGVLYDNLHSPFVLMYTGLPLRVHKIKIVNKSSASLYVDYFGQLRSANSSTPLIILKANYQDSIGSAAINVGQNTNSAIFRGNEMLDSVVQKWNQRYPFYIVPTFIDTLSGICSVDHVHPNNKGDSLEAAAILSYVPNAVTPLGYATYKQGFRNLEVNRLGSKEISLLSRSEGLKVGESVKYIKNMTLSQFADLNFIGSLKFQTPAGTQGTGKTLVSDRLGNLNYSDTVPEWVADTLTSQTINMTNLGAPASINFPAQGSINMVDGLTAPNILFGNAFSVQHFAGSAWLLGQTQGYHGSGLLGSGGAWSMIDGIGGSMFFYAGASSTAGSPLSLGTSNISTFSSGNTAMGSDADLGTTAGKLQISATTEPQLVLSYPGNGTLNLGMSGYALNFLGLYGSINTLSAAIPPVTSPTTSDSLHMGRTTAGVETWSKIAISDLATLIGGSSHNGVDTITFLSDSISYVIHYHNGSTDTVHNNSYSGGASFGAVVQNPANVILQLVGSNTAAIPLATHLLAGLVDSGQDATIDSARFRKGVWATLGTGGGSGVTSVASGYGTNFTTITATGTVVVDSSVMMTKGTNQQVSGRKDFTGETDLTGVTSAGAGGTYKMLVVDTSLHYKVLSMQITSLDTSGSYLGDSTVTYSPSSGKFFLSNVSAKSYTPTLTNTTNVSSSTLNGAYFSRNGSIVHVRIFGSMTVTSATSNTDLTFTLPFTTTVTSVNGVGSGIFQPTSTPGWPVQPGFVNIISGTQCQLQFYTGSNVSLGPFTLEFDYSLN